MRISERARRRVVLAGEVIGFLSVPLAFLLQWEGVEVFGIYASIPTIIVGIVAATVAVGLRLVAEYRTDRARRPRG